MSKAAAMVPWCAAGIGCRMCIADGARDWDHIRRWQEHEGVGAGLSLIIGELESESKLGHVGIAVADRLPLHSLAQAKL